MNCRQCQCRTLKSGAALTQLPVGTHATVVKILPQSRGRKKFADTGLVPGTDLLMEAHAPFGGLLRIKVMGASIAIDRSDAEYIIVKQ